MNLIFPRIVEVSCFDNWMDIYDKYHSNYWKTLSNYGYIGWKDGKVLVFYTNDLIDTPTKNLLHSTNESDSEEAIPCVGGLEYVERWDDDWRSIRKLFLCPLFITLNTMFMKGLDCEDQRIETMVKLNLLVQHTVTLIFDVDC